MNHLTIDQLRTLADSSLTANVPVPDQFKDGTPYHAFLYLLAQALDPKLIVELGTGKEARGAAHFAAGAPNAKVISIDSSYVAPISHENVHLLQGDSLTLKDKITALNMPIQILFVDTTHETAHALEEYNLYLPLMEKGGIVLFDDLLLGGMEGLWEEIPEPKWFSDTLHGSCGFGMAVNL